MIVWPEILETVNNLRIQRYVGQGSSRKFLQRSLYRNQQIFNQVTFESWIITMHAIIVMENLYRLKELKDLRLSLFFLSFIHILFFLSLSLHPFVRLFLPPSTKRIQFDLLKPDRSLIQLHCACKPTSIQYLPCLGLRSVSEIQKQMVQTLLFSPC